MATRSLTEVFVLMRNNAMRNKNAFLENYNATMDNPERMQLISLNDMEQGNGMRNESRMPPVWIDQLEEAQYTLTKLKSKINELKSLHARNMHRPTFDDSSEDEKLIENCSSDASNMFNTVHRLMQFIKSHIYEGSLKERELTGNVVRALGTSLQELSSQFRSTQNDYLKQIKSREERSRAYFDTPSLEDDYVFDNDDIDDYFVNSKQATHQQLLYLEEENMKIAQQREQEVNSIVKSILDLNDIFKDLNQMVADQGTILDRIDYNIEQSQTQVYEGFKQLQKADAYQRKNRKMCAIIILSLTIVVLFFILVIVKS